MLLIITPTGATWAWVIKHRDRDRAIAVGFGYKSAAEAKVVGGSIIDLIQED